MTVERESEEWLDGDGLIDVLHAKLEETIQKYRKKCGAESEVEDVDNDATEEDFDAEAPSLDDQSNDVKHVIFCWVASGVMPFTIGRQAWKQIPTLRRYQHRRDAHLVAQMCRTRDRAREDVELTSEEENQPAASPLCSGGLLIYNEEVESYVDSIDWQGTSKWIPDYEEAKKRFPSVEELLEEAIKVVGKVPKGGKAKCEGSKIETLRAMWAVKQDTIVEMEVDGSRLVLRERD